MKIKILRGTVAGGVAVRPGDIVDASKADAKLLIAIGKAEAYVPAPVVEKKVEPKPEKEAIKQSFKKVKKTKK